MDRSNGVIQKGTGGLSRGDEKEVATIGVSLGGMAPLHMCEALYKSPFCLNVSVVLLLMMNRWRKQLLKATDVNFVLNPGSEMWPFSQHGPLGMFTCLPLRRHELRRLKKTKPVVDLDSALREVQDTDHIQKGGLLREFLRLARQVDTMPESVMYTVLQTHKRW
jgi:hypothetical protein